MWNSLTWVFFGVLLVALGWIVKARRNRSSNKQVNEQRGSNVVEFRPRKSARQSRTGNESKSKGSSGSRVNTKAAGIHTKLDLDCLTQSRHWQAKMFLL